MNSVFSGPTSFLIQLISMIKAVNRTISLWPTVTFIFLFLIGSCNNGYVESTLNFLRHSLSSFLPRLHLPPSTDNLNLEHLNSVFKAVRFPRRDPDKIRLSLDHTGAVLWVEYEKTRRPVASARAMVGLGKAVMERLVTDLLEKGINNFAFYSEPQVLGFYRPLRFVVDPDGIRGMLYSRKQKKKK
ncbi:GCN5-related N-acetyltransferase 1, chloroplastic [Castilleja foliolosa]|uniref:GCN5-related N-acetyltransferase 1, chloroplastic n=1 Tax=Castilleja foliolosa TaxID=1961234 RepID=A0ABD3BYW5_9LAMI